jgi:hypothetical protein
MKNIVPAITLLLLTSLNTHAQVKKASVADLSFMTGTWVQKNDWGDLEEFWGAPTGDNMVSSFRCVKDEKVILYEFVVIEQDGAMPVMKIRHFNRRSMAWEEKDKPFLLPLVSLAGNEATFESLDKSVRLTYTRAAADKMDVILNERDKNGVWKKDVFNYNLKQ